MRTTALVSTLVVVLLTGNATTSVAQTPVPGSCCYVRFGFGLGTYAGDRDENPLNEFGKWFSSAGVTFHLDGGMAVSRDVHVVASYGLSRLPRLGSSSGGSNVDGYNPYRHSLHLETPIYISTNRRVSPYVSPSVGVYFGTVNRPLGMQTAFSPGLGVGLDVSVGSQWSIYLQITGRLSVGDRQLDGLGTQNSDVLALATGGVRYSFASGKPASLEGIPETEVNTKPETSGTPVQVAADATAPEIEDLPAATPVYSTSLGRFVVRVDSFRVIDLESGVARVDHRLRPVRHDETLRALDDDSLTWITLAEPRTDTYLVPGFVRDLPADSGEMELEIRIVNSAGLPHRVRIPFKYRMDETPPTLSGVPAHFLRINGREGLEVMGGRIRDPESGIARIRYRVLDVASDSVLIDWTELKTSNTVFLSESEYLFGNRESVRVDFTAENGHGLEEFFTVSISTEENAVERETAPTGLAAVERSRPEPAPEPDAGDDTPPTVGNVRAYVRSGALHMFVENLADLGSPIARAEFRLLDVDGQVVADWSAYPLVPAGKSHYRILLHKVAMEAGPRPAAVEFRAFNRAGLSVRMRQSLE